MTADALDPRVTPYRDDIAADFLSGRVEAAAFVPGAPRRVAVAHAALMTRPDQGALQASELLFGEAFTVFEDKDGWSWGQAGADGYVGYVLSTALAESMPAPTHRVTAARSLVFPDPKGEYPPLLGLSMMAAVAVDGEDGDYARLATGGWMFKQHLAATDETRPDWIATAKLFLGTPYLWGGRGGLGIDCSGLIQVPLAVAGIEAPRDSDMQADAIGGDVAVPEDTGDLRLGDILFFPGHVGIYLGEEGMLHASSHSMMVSVHPLADVLSRMHERHGTGITRVRRLVV